MDIIHDDVQITTFGYLHGAPPKAHLTLDLREHFRDPHVSPELRHLTARDPKVQTAVLNTPGIPRLIDAAASMVLAFRAGPSSSAGPVTVAIGCAGGRHRAATFGMELAGLLYRWAINATITHRDLDKDVVGRGELAEDGVDR